jgi:hypothetical protein
METASFIEAFRRLQTSEREQALEALTRELSPYEWRSLHATTGTRSFQFDIIGKLPVELVAQIFQYLDTTAPYRYHIVSRRWNDTLRSLHILKATLSQWYVSTTDLQDATYNYCLKRAHRIHAFRTGQPCSILKITPTDEIRELLLRGDHLAWLQPQNYRDTIRSAYILHLPTWSLRTVSGEGREKLRDIFASDELVVLTTFANICYVHEVAGSQSFKKFRVPNKAYFANMAVRGKTVACVCDLGASTEVYIWHFCTGRGTSFKILHTPGSLFGVSDPTLRSVFHIAPVIQPTTKTIVLFTNAYLSKEQPHHRKNIAFGRYTYTGECLGTSQPSLPAIGQMMSWSYARFWNPTGYNGRWAMWLKSRPWGSEAGNRVTTSFLLRFDEKDNHLSVWGGSRLPGSDCGFYTGGCLAWWKDTCYGHLLPSDTTEKRNMLAFMGTEGDAKIKALVGEDEEMKMAHAWENVTASVQLNEKYVMRNVLDRFYLLCFDEDEGRKRSERSGAFFDQGTVEVLR